MKERPILFRNEMVEAILRELPKIPKTQTRRGMKPQPTSSIPDEFKMWGLWGDQLSLADTRDEEPETKEEWTCPYGQPGDRLWVKETHWRWGKWIKNGVNAKGKPRWKFRAFTHDFGVRFTAPAPPPKRGKLGWHKRPSLFMPRLAARAVLEIVKVRAERLQDISEADAISEGVDWRECPSYQTPDQMASMIQGRNCAATVDYVGGYKRLWESINGVGSWDLNDYVWVIEFKRL